MTYFGKNIYQILIQTTSNKACIGLLDAFAEALIKTAEEAKTDPELLHATRFGRMGEVRAARELVFCCWLSEDYENQ